MIQGIFYARFLPQEGTKIVAQSPPGCIVATTYTPHLKPPLVDFDIIQEYIIPRKAFFNRFITVDSPDSKYSVLGFPVSIPNERYHRNEFIFNFGLVVESDVDQIPYEKLVRRLAVTFAEMERQNGYLSSADGGVVECDGRRPIESLLEIVKEDLNNYGECMIPVDDANTLNMKLFPYHAPPPAVCGWHVPVPKMKLGELVDPTWDLTLQRIIPHIDGVNDVRRVAWHADVSLPLAQCALQHLLYYDTILLLDMFFFGSCYAPRPGMHEFITNKHGLVDECGAYVRIARFRAGDDDKSHVRHSLGPGTEPADITSGIVTGNNHDSNLLNSTAATTSNDTVKRNGITSGTRDGVSHYQLIKLMTTFCVGRSVMEWIKLHQDAGFDVLRQIDVRRLVQFGVIKGLLFRVHKYVVSKQYLAQLATGRRAVVISPSNGPKTKGNKKGNGKGKGMEKEKEKMVRSSNEGEEGAANAGDVGRNQEGEEDEEEEAGDGGKDKSEEEAVNSLLGYADGRHCFDQIIIEQNMTDAEIMQRLKSFQPQQGDLTVFYR